MISNYKKNLQKKGIIILKNIFSDDTGTVKILFNKSNAIFNFAALSDIKKSNDNPLETVKVNILGVVNLLNLCIKKKIFLNKLMNS